MALMRAVPDWKGNYTMTQFDPRNITMMMDLYELTMANGYFTDKQEDKSSRVTFDVFYRKNPDGGGFSIFAASCGVSSTTAFSPAQPRMPITSG